MSRAVCLQTGVAGCGRLGGGGRGGGGRRRPFPGGSVGRPVGAGALLLWRDRARPRPAGLLCEGQSSAGRAQNSGQTSPSPPHWQRPHTGQLEPHPSAGRAQNSGHTPSNHNHHHHYHRQDQSSVRPHTHRKDPQSGQSHMPHEDTACRSLPNGLIIKMSLPSQTRCVY